MNCFAMEMEINRWISIIDLLGWPMSIEREGRCRQNGRDANFKYVGCHVRRDVTEASRASLKMAA